jgi:hypothetical protein
MLKIKGISMLFVEQIRFCKIFVVKVVLEIKKEDLVSSNDDQGLHFYYISCFLGNLFNQERIKKIALKRIN